MQLVGEAAELNLYQILGMTLVWVLILGKVSQVHRRVLEL
jgi:hypothetical protein